MPRLPRLFLPGATYHVYCRIARGEFVFDDDFEAVEFIEALRKVRDLDGWTILAWCLTGNLPYESASGRALDILVSWQRSTMHVTGRIEFCVLAVSTCRPKTCEIASLRGKSRNSVTLWLKIGLCQECDDPEFAAGINPPDATISRR